VPVRPRELLFVEDARAVTDTVEREPPCELVDRQQLRGIIGAGTACG
jgi:hypothetical protein